MTYTPVQRAVQWIAALLFTVAGLGHFLSPESLIRFIPPYLPDPATLVLLSGIAEVAGGMGLLLPRFRRIAAWGLAAMLISFLPANIYMAAHPAEAGLASVPTVVFWARIALLPVMIWCLLWCSRPAGRAS